MNLSVLSTAHRRIAHNDLWVCGATVFEQHHPDYGAAECCAMRPARAKKERIHRLAVGPVWYIQHVPVVERCAERKRPRAHELNVAKGVSFDATVFGDLDKNTRF